MNASINYLEKGKVQGGIFTDVKIIQVTENLTELCGIPEALKKIDNCTAWLQLILRVNKGMLMYTGR